MALILEENAQHMESRVYVASKKSISKFAVPEIEKRHTKSRKRRLTASSLPILNLFVETISIQGVLNMYIPQSLTELQTF